MAQIIQHPCAGHPPVVQTRTCGRLPKQITSIRTFINERSYVSYRQRVLQEEINQKLTAAAGCEQVGKTLLYEAAALQSRLQRGEI